MAKTKKVEDKVVLERNFNVPLRREFLKSPKYKRGKKAVTALRSYLVRHMKSDNIKIGKYANLKIWEKGIRNPPHHIKIVAKKTEKGVVSAELEGAPVEVKPEPVKKKAVTKDTDKSSISKEGAVESDFKKLEEKTEKIKQEKQESAAAIQKEEIKELKKEKFPAPKKDVVDKKVEHKPIAPSGKSESRKP